MKERQFKPCDACLGTGEGRHGRDCCVCNGSGIEPSREAVKAKGEMTPGGLIKQWRDERGLTQEKAAEALGVNLRSLQNWEGGRRPSSAIWALLKGRLV